MASSYQFAFDKAMTDLKEKDPVVVCHNAGAEYSTISGKYAVPFFKRPFIADMNSGEVYDKESGTRAALGTGMLILHYLAFAQAVEPSGRWITLKEVPNGGMVFYPAFKKEVLDALVATFQYDLAAFDRAAAALSGEKLKMGHSAAVFQAFPKVPLAVLLWEGDEEFGGSANFLFDSTVEYFSPVETIIGFGYYLGHKLVRSPFAPTSSKRQDPFWDDGIESSSQ
ncbi:MAG: hypothetical protein K0R55_1488 [Sporomusa sp.]|nr:hypothetical protein [Sporomusa sp.]